MVDGLSKEVRYLGIGESIPLWRQWKLTGGEDGFQALETTMKGKECERMAMTTYLSILAEVNHGIIQSTYQVDHVLVRPKAAGIGNDRDGR